MPKAYSEDLRGRVWAAWQEGNESQRAVAARFGVSESFVRDLSRRFRATGSVAAKAHGGGRRLAADTKTIARLEALVAKHNDLTNDEYHRRLCAKGAARLSRSAVGRLLLRLGLTRKKRRSKTTSARANG
jgi:transposase